MKLTSGTFKRWAVATTDEDFLLGKFYWSGATEDDLKIPTWRTRKLARQAAAACTFSRWGSLRVVKVDVIIKPVEE